jgi:hypothetical protein
MFRDMPLGDVAASQASQDKPTEEASTPFEGLTAGQASQRRLAVARATHWFLVIDGFHIC